MDLRAAVERQALRQARPSRPPSHSRALATTFCASAPTTSIQTVGVMPRWEYWSTMFLPFLPGFHRPSVGQEARSSRHSQGWQCPMLFLARRISTVHCKPGSALDSTSVGEWFPVFRPPQSRTILHSMLLSLTSPRPADTLCACPSMMDTRLLPRTLP